MAPDSPGGPSAVRVALVFPDLLGTYGDSGNAVILAQRLRWRGHPAEIVEINAGGVVPDSCDLYVIGGGEDQPQSLAARDLNIQRSLHRAVDRGAAVLAVCAGLQILGRTFVGPDGVEQPGLDLFDCVTVRGRGRRAVGELVVEPGAERGLPVMTGYENHGGVTILSPDAQPLGVVRSGVGNGHDAGHDAGPDAGPDAGHDAGRDGRPGYDIDQRGRLVDGVVNGRVWGTYMHGPVLARNPAFADLLLGLVTGPLSPLDDGESEALRAERLDAAKGEASGRNRRWIPPPGLTRWVRSRQRVR
jgi:CobQ-like glutamine amidotransferase family enzyme